MSLPLTLEGVELKKQLESEKLITKTQEFYKACYNLPGY